MTARRGGLPAAEAVAAGRMRPSRDPAARAAYLVDVGIGALLVHLRPAPARRRRPPGGAARLRRRPTALPALGALHRGAAHRPLDARHLPRLRPAGRTSVPLRSREAGMTAAPAVEICGLTKTLRRPSGRSTASTSRSRPARSHGFLGPNGSGQVHHHPGPARPAARRRGRGRGCSAATPGPTRSSCTAGSPTSPATSPCGPTSPAARRSTCSAGCAAARPAPPGRAARAVRARPDQEGPHLLQGQPAEGRPRRRAGRRRRAAAPRRADLRARPADGGGVPASASARSRAAGRTVLLSSHILAEVEELCDRVTIIRDGRTVESGTLAELRHLTRTTVTAVTERRPGRAGRAARRARPGRRGRPRPVPGRHAELRRGRCAARRARRAQPRHRAAVAGGAVPAPLRRRAGRDRRVPR